MEDAGDGAHYSFPLSRPRPMHPTGRRFSCLLVGNQKHESSLEGDIWAHLILLGPLFLMKNVIALRLRGDPANRGNTFFSVFRTLGCPWTNIWSYKQGCYGLWDDGFGGETSQRNVNIINLSLVKTLTLWYRHEPNDDNRTVVGFLYRSSTFCYLLTNVESWFLLLEAVELFKCEPTV